jgi:acyl-CoA synthetase (AMP-forming)/AMP-acid ligase II
VAQAVVDELEAVEVDHAGGDETLGPACAADRRAQTIQEERAVGQRGQAVVQCLVAQRFLGLPLLGKFDQPGYVVAAIPDEKKGERIIVLHTLSDEDLAPVLVKLAESDLPALWKPKKDQFFHVDTLPYLGSGKLDLRALKTQAAALAGTTA